MNNPPELPGTAAEHFRLHNTTRVVCIWPCRLNVVSMAFNGAAASWLGFAGFVYTIQGLGGGTTPMLFRAWVRVPLGISVYNACWLAQQLRVARACVRVLVLAIERERERERERARAREEKARYRVQALLPEIMGTSQCHLHLRGEYVA